MLSRGDRSLPGSWNLLAAAIVLALLGVSGLVFWWKMAGRSGPPETVPDQVQGSATMIVPRDEPVPMTVYLPAQARITPISIPVKRRLEAQAQAREIIQAILAEEQHEKGVVLTGVELRELYVDGAGTAYADLSVIPKEGIRSSAWEEFLAVYALVNSLTQNIQEIKRVRFLLEGKEAQILAGHIDLTRTYTMRMDLVQQ